MDCIVVDYIFLNEAEESNAMASGLTPEKGGDPPKKAPPLAQSSKLSAHSTLSQVLPGFNIHPHNFATNMSSVDGLKEDIMTNTVHFNKMEKTLEETLSMQAEIDDRLRTVIFLTHKRRWHIKLLCISRMMLLSY